MNYRFFFLFVVNMLCVLAYPQELKLSFSEPFNSVGLESISCIPIEDKIVHVQQKSNEDLCALTVHVYDAQLKKKASFELNEPKYTFLSVKYSLYSYSHHPTYLHIFEFQFSLIDHL